MEVIDCAKCGKPLGRSLSQVRVVVVAQVHAYRGVAVNSKRIGSSKSVRYEFHEECVPRGVDITNPAIQVLNYVQKKKGKE